MSSQLRPLLLVLVGAVCCARVFGMILGEMENEQIARLFENDHFATGNDIRLAEVRPGYARTEMTVEPRHHNAVGILQGGALFTLADLAFAGASNSHGVVAVACQADFTWFKAVQSGKLTATAEEISRTRKLSTCLIRITDEAGELVGLFKGVAYIKGTPLEEFARMPAD